MIVRAREVDALDHSTEAYQLGLKDVKEEVEAADTGLYFRRWTRLNGFLGATRRSLNWAVGHSAILFLAGLAVGLALEELIGRLQKKAYDWEGNEATA